MDSDLQISYLHWVADDERWEDVASEDWLAFRDFRGPKTPLPNIPAGVQHFMVVVREQNGEIVNLIPHKYLIQPDGKTGPENFAGLNKEERNDLDRIFRLSKYGPGDEERYREIMNKLEPSIEPPAGSIPALKQKLPSKPPSDSAASRFLARFG